MTQQKRHQKKATTGSQTRVKGEEGQRGRAARETGPPPLDRGQGQGAGGPETEAGGGNRQDRENDQKSGRNGWTRAGRGEGWHQEEQRHEGQGRPEDGRAAGRRQQDAGAGTATRRGRRGSGG